MKIKLRISRDGSRKVTQIVRPVQKVKEPKQDWDDAPIYFGKPLPKK